MIFFLDGAFLDQPRAIAVDNRGFLIGDGAFETIALFDGRPAFLDRHIERLRRGLTALAMEKPAGLEELGGVLMALARRNGFTHGAAAARVTVTRGGGRGLDVTGGPVTFLATISPTAAVDEPILLTLTVQRKAATTLDFKAVGDYLPNLRARREARARGAGEGVLSNEAGRIIGAAAANLFVIVGDGLVMTPATADGALPGVVRGLLLSEAPSAGVSLGEAALSPLDLAGRALLVSNSLIGVRAARLQAAQPRPLPEDARRLQTCYADLLADDLRSFAA